MRARSIPVLALALFALGGCIPGSQGAAPFGGAPAVQPKTPPAQLTGDRARRPTPTTARATPTTARPAPPATYLFDDEFAGASLDLARWQPNWFGGSNTAVTKPVNSAEATCYAPSQATVPGDGSLHLTAVPRACTVNGYTYPYTSGLVETAPHFTFTTGRLEARVFLPGTAGAITDWPAVWTDGTGNWPSTGESDIVEGLGGRACYHYHSPAGGPGACVGGNFTGWHTYVEEVRNGTTTYYYDGIKVGSLTNVNAPHYLILNLGVATGGAAAPATMLVDYVRVTP